MFFVKNLSMFIISKCAKILETYVVQTEDNKLHFITNKMETHQLNFENFSNYVQDNRNELRDSEKNLVARFDTRSPELKMENSVKKANRIDQIFVTNDGFINFFGKTIFIEDIVIHPIVENGIYIAASQEHIPMMINNTIVITAISKIYILDFYNYASRSVKFTQLLYLYEMFKNIPRKDNEAYINKKWWTFDSRITAIYMLKEKDGLNFMLRIIGKSDVALYEKKILKKKSRKLPFIIMWIPILVSIMYFNRNVRYDLCILKNKLYIGKFIKKNCLIYRVSKSFLNEHKRVYSNLKHNSFINIFNESDGFFFPYIVTERTTQYKSKIEIRKQSESSEKSQEVSSTDSEAFVKITNFFNKEPDISENLTTETYKAFVKYFNTKVYDENKQSEREKFKKDLYLIIEGIEYLHSINHIHGRLCPENIRLSDQKEIKIQNMFDNVGWRSIKQLKNLKNKEYLVDCIDDAFSLGCVLHYYLTGYHPFDLREFVKKERKSFKKSKEVNVVEEKNSVCSENEENVQSSDENVVDQSERSKIEKLKQIACIFCNKVCQFFNSVSQHLNNDSLFKLSIFSFIFKKKNTETHPHIYKRILSDDTAKYIEYNILYNTYKIRLEDQVEHDLIYHCIKSPYTQIKCNLTCHPYFWDNAKSLEFICDASDFIETNSSFKTRLEKSRKIVFNGSWFDSIDSVIIKSVSVKRTYDHQSICDLIRFIRNCHRHYQELRNKEFFEVLEGKLFSYFSHMFPELLMFLYRNPIFKNQVVLKKYYESVL